jgi:uncharacterized membrane protein
MIIVGILLLFIPGLAISWLFFEKHQIDWLERIALSFVLSVSVVPLLLFYVNLVGIPINQLTVISTVVLIMCFVGFGLIIKHAIKKH